MTDTAEVVCPWCLERVELFVDPDTRGRLVEDCEICCRPWDVRVERDELTGELAVAVLRAQ